PTGASAEVRQRKSGALSPGLSCGPTSVFASPLKVTAFSRFCMGNSSVAAEIGGELSIGRGHGGRRERLNLLYEPLRAHGHVEQFEQLLLLVGRQRQGEAQHIAERAER